MGLLQLVMALESSCVDGNANNENAQRGLGREKKKGREVGEATDGRTKILGGKRFERAFALA